MESEMYPSHLEPAGLQIIVPTPDERAAVHEIYFGELVLGIINDESRAALSTVVASMRDRDGIDAVILGGTELALILTEPACAGVPVLDTARVHVETAVDWLLGGP